ncbi:MAG TPA: adenylate/guanylate cyclase domain-containing protein [Actinomycetota bacterium]|nr:adenylate/guanylate cyclase domain-containing protein [Actinomycetota bacterium]
MLFADLVGFTAMSEERDPEEVRELLTRYFDTARRLVGLYGGTIEKFIGDAVMAVWGTPVAQEDDAERAVRAALDLVEAVRALGAELGTEDLKARVGVLTGEAAVTIGAEGQGMVAGDLVNTASRIQSAAEPGSVLVGEVTRRSTEAAIAYEDAGSHAMKGKAEPLPLWRALRVLGGRGGALKSSGLEAPFVGRDRELRLVKELFHGSADEKKAHLLSVVGIGGIGKSRLSWEFYKYIDGLADLVYWHRGRCLAYGEGVTYWALAEMVRMRARIAEAEDQRSASEKLRAVVEEFVPDPEERKWIEPRLANLLGVEERTTGERSDLFSAWRLFFERLADVSPTVLVFEDLQWADKGLMDFIEYLLEWSRNHPLFVVTLARPELTDRHPAWGSGKRNFTSLNLEPLGDHAMRALLDGLAPGLPPELEAEILGRAEGVPLYAVETVRMLIDRGLLVREGARYRVAGDVPALEVPETLHALIAARLDGLTPDERQVIQHASILGKTFTKSSVGALSGRSEGEVEGVLNALVRKEVLGLQADPRAPERGQYGFLQDLVRRVAYQTLSKRERKTLHLAAAEWIKSSWSDEQEIVEVLASHYVEAYQAVPDAPDANEIKAKAAAALVGAGRRASSLAAHGEAQRYYEQALGLTDDAADRGRLLEQAGRSALLNGSWHEAMAHLAAAVNVFEAADDHHAAARVSARLAFAEWRTGKLDEGIRRLEAAFDVLASEPPDHDIAEFAAELARLHFFAGNSDLSVDRADLALQISEALWFPDVLSEALNTKSLVLVTRGRPEEAMGLLTHALKIALENDVPEAALRAYNNLAVLLLERDRHEDALQVLETALELAAKVGDRVWTWGFTGSISASLWWLGRWDEALARIDELPSIDEASGVRAIVHQFVPQLVVTHLHRGNIDEAERAMDLVRDFAEAPDVQERIMYWSLTSSVAMTRRDARDALAAADRVIEARGVLSLRNEFIRDGYVKAIEASIALGDLIRARERLAELENAEASELSPYLRANTARLRALIAAAAEQREGMEQDFKAAVGMFREIGVPFFLATTLLEYGEWLAKQERLDDARPILDEARGILEGLKARPWLERLARLEAPGSRVAV